jgi:quercetin dioxygenase-like cupin family protein
MPYVGPGEALDRAVVDLGALAAELGPPSWRAVLAGTDAIRVVLLRWPPGYATVPHRHPSADELFVVLDGQAAFVIGDGPERVVGPGSFLFADRGVEHAIRVEGDTPLTLLAAVAPNQDRADETVE